ncbi:unnamed protein product [Rotaria socialis]
MFLLYGHEQVDAVEQSQTRIINQKKSARYNYQSVGSLLANQRIIRFWNSWLIYISSFRLCQVMSSCFNYGNPGWLWL